MSGDAAQDGEQQPQRAREHGAAGVRAQEQPRAVRRAPQQGLRARLRAVVHGV